MSHKNAVPMPHHLKERVKAIAWFAGSLHKPCRVNIVGAFFEGADCVAVIGEKS